MSKKVFAIVTSLFLLGGLVSLIAVNSFFRENSRLLIERRELKQENHELIGENQLLKSRIPPTPKGIVVERVGIKEATQTEGNVVPKYTVDFVVKNPTNESVSENQAVLIVQENDNGEYTRWNYSSVKIGSIPPGESRNVVTNPMTLGKPGTSVEVLVTLVDQPGIAKTIFRVPEDVLEPIPN